MTAVLAIGTAAWDPVAGVTMGAGAMLVGTAWRIRGGRPPLTLLATDAFVMALSTFVGCVTGSIGWLHLVVVGIWALMAGLLVSLGNSGGVVGTQAVIAVVVFGRFSQPAAASAALAGLVLAGGWSQVLFLALVGWPGALRAQRAATANAFRALANLAPASSETSPLPATDALDAAQDALSSATLFGDPALMTLRSLVGEGHRLRVGLSAIHGLTRLEPAVSRGDPPPEVTERMLELTAEALNLCARAIEGDATAATPLSHVVTELSNQADSLSPGPEPAVAPLSRRLAALAGQVRAVCALAIAAGESGTLGDRRPRAHYGRRRGQTAAAFAQIRANARLQSPAGRHALRLAVVVLVAELVSRHLPLQRGYWMVVAAATTIRPEFGATFTRGTERALGTALGVGIAGAIVVALHPAGGATTVIVGLLAWVAYAVFPASFAVGFAFITAMVVFLLNAISPDTLATAWARLLDTLAGGALGLLAYAVWPTWSDTPARQALADLLAAQRAYIGAILKVVADGGRVDEDQMRDLSRRARLERTSAEATVARSLSEPATRRIDAEQSQAALAAMRRLVQAAHVLRLDVQDDRDRGPLPSVDPLAGDLDAQLSSVEAALAPRGEEPAPARSLPDLRARYQSMARSAPHDVEEEGLLAELDELVDAANSLVAAVGLEPADDAVDSEAAAASGTRSSP
ncbi:MAG: FUSC family protein [Solirubrobacterales bacterium]|nr:FUSC family protein [Solirubrobacterales bacterium]